MKDRKFFYFVIHVTCIQTALNLEAAGQQTSLDDTNLALMAILYQLLEDVIIILSTASPFDAGDDEEDEDEEDYDDDEDDDDLDDDDDNDYLPGKKVNLTIRFIQFTNLNNILFFKKFFVIAVFSMTQNLGNR